MFTARCGLDVQIFRSNKVFTRLQSLTKFLAIQNTVPLQLPNVWALKPVSNVCHYNYHSYLQFGHIISSVRFAVLQLLKQRITAICYHLLVLFLITTKPAADTHNKTDSINLSHTMMPTRGQRDLGFSAVINKKLIKNTRYNRLAIS